MSKGVAALGGLRIPVRAIISLERNYLIFLVNVYNLTLLLCGLRIGVHLSLTHFIGWRKIIKISIWLVHRSFSNLPPIELRLCHYQNSIFKAKFGSENNTLTNQAYEPTYKGRKNYTSENSHRAWQWKD